MWEGGGGGVGAVVIQMTIALGRHTIYHLFDFVISLIRLLTFVVSYKRKYAHEVLVNCLFKLAQEKVWL